MSSCVTSSHNTPSVTNVTSATHWDNTHCVMCNGPASQLASNIGLVCTFPCLHKANLHYYNTNRYSSATFTCDHCSKVTTIGSCIDTIIVHPTTFFCTKKCMVQKFSAQRKASTPVLIPTPQQPAIHPTGDSHVVLVAPRVIVTPIVPKQNIIIQTGVMMPTATPLFGMASNMGTFVPVEYGHFCSRRSRVASLLISVHLIL